MLGHAMASAALNEGVDLRYNHRVRRILTQGRAGERDRARGRPPDRGEDRGLEPRRANDLPRPARSGSGHARDARVPRQLALRSRALPGHAVVRASRAPRLQVGPARSRHQPLLLHHRRVRERGAGVRVHPPGVRGAAAGAARRRHLGEHALGSEPGPAGQARHERLVLLPEGIRPDRGRVGRGEEDLQRPLPRAVGEVRAQHDARQRDRRRALHALRHRAGDGHARGGLRPRAAQGGLPRPGRRGATGPWAGRGPGPKGSTCARATASAPDPATRPSRRSRRTSSSPRSGNETTASTETAERRWHARHLHDRVVRRAQGSAQPQPGHGEERSERTVEGARAVPRRRPLPLPERGRAALLRRAPGRREVHGLLRGGRAAAPQGVRLHLRDPGRDLRGSGRWNRPIPWKPVSRARSRSRVTCAS